MPMDKRSSGFGSESRRQKYLKPVLHFFKEYSASTTFHGFTYIFNAVTYFGKTIWFVLFTLALSAFIYQVYDRVSYYLSRPVNVDISIIIKDTVKFPAITICNTNAYKISTAFEKNLYSNLTEFYQLDEVAKPAYKALNGYDSIELMTMLGHSKYDLIKQCFWLGKPCGAHNFTITMTDYGPCFTFNNEMGGTRLEVSNTGASYGLELLLNIEQYENMAGPHKAAGIKVLAHEPADLPRIQDLGISVPASMTAMLGLSLAESKHLSPPHGECGTYPLKHQSVYSKSACEMECYTDLLEARCGCVHYSMRGNDVCPLPKQYGCVQQTMENARRDGICSSKKRCPLPCLERQYSADISYSATSHFETIKLASLYSQDPSLYRRFLNATLVKHQVLPELYTAEKNLIAESYEHIVSMNSTVLEMKEEMEQWKLFLKSNIETNLAEVLRNMQNSVVYLRDMYDNEFRLTKHRMFLTIFLYKVDFILAVARQQRKYVNPFVDAGNLRSETQTCNYFFRNMLDDLESIVYALSDTYDVYDRQYNTDSPPEQINDSVVRNWYDEVRRFGGGYIRQLVVLNNKTIEFKDAAYYLCGRMAQFQFLSAQVKSRLLDTMIEKAVIMKREVESTASNLRSLLENLQVYETDVGVIAGYVNQYSYSVSIRLAASNKAVDDIVNFLNRLLPNIQSLHEQFEAGDIPTKTAVLDLMKNVISATAGSSHGLVEQFDEMFHKVISECEQMAQAMLILHDVLEGAFNGLKHKHRGGFMERFSYLSGNLSIGNEYFHEMTDKLQHFSGSGEVFRTSVNKLMERLNEFIATLDIDEKFIKANFMRLHVYYTSLSFHTVNKHAAYLWFSLLCDVGGAAGLLLGASTLSILELIYFIGKCCFPGKHEPDLEASRSVDSLSRQQYKEIKKANRDHIKKLMNQNGHTYL